MEPRADSHVRCAYCHAPADDDARACERCRTVVHADCLIANGGCPTLACDPARVTNKALPASPPTAEGSGRLRLVVLGVAALALVPLYFEQFVWFVLAASGLASWAAASLAEWSLAREERRRGVGALDVPAVPVTVAELDASLRRVDDWLELEAPDGEARRAQEALATAPTDAVEQLRLGLARLGRGATHDAEVALEAALTQGAHLVAPVSARVAALAHAARGEWTAALAALEGQAPASRRRVLGAALARAARGEWGHARRALDAWRRPARGDAAADLVLRSRLRRCAGDVDAALALADEAFRGCDADDPWPHEARARLRLLTGQPGRALEDLAVSAARASRGEAGPHLTRGVVRAITGDLVGARRDLQAALDRAPGWAQPRLWLAALGDDVKVDDAFERALLRCVRGAAPADEVLALAAPAGPRRARLAHGLLGVAAEVRGDLDLARSHAAAVRELGDDGTHVCDWAFRDPDVRSAT